jgi:hypothetical protein
VAAAITLPECLKPLAGERRWLIWRFEQTENGKPTKVPYRANAPSVKASVSDPATWVEAQVALKAHTNGEGDGIGLALLNAPITAFDIDGCISDAGVLHDWARQFIERCGATYVEVTPSRHGLRVLGNGTGPHIHTKLPVANGMSVEIYRRCPRYITVSGDRFQDAPDRLGELDEIADQVKIELEAARQSKAKTTFAVSNGKPQQLPSLEEVIKHGHFGIWGGDRSRAEWYVVNQLVRSGKSDDEVVAVITNVDNAIAAHCLSKPENPRQYALRTIGRARAELTAKGAVTADGTPDDVGIKVAELAKLSAADYERQRKAAAEALGFRATILDRLVQAERDRDRAATDKSQGHTIALTEPKPWDEVVNGADLLDAIEAQIGNYVILPEHACRAVALWIVHSYLTESFLISPRLCICSPTKGCGKTTLLDVISRMALRPLAASNVSAAAIFRVIEKCRPTLLIDEADSFLGNSDELRGVLNSGHRKGGAVLRVTGDDYEPRLFATYGPCAIALIGVLPSTLADRSITVELARRRPSEKVQPFRLDKVEHLDRLARQCARWAGDNAVAVGAADTALPPEVANRQADNWQVLKQIAVVAGGNWANHVDEAARAAAKAGAGDEEWLVQLLSDIRDTPFPGDAGTTISSAALVEHLVDLEARPWGEMGREGKKLTQNRLARMLKPLAIAPERVGPEASRTRGYRRNAFETAFERYLDPLPLSQPSNRPECDEIRVSRTSQPSSPESGWTVEKCEKSNNDGVLDGWTVANPEKGQIARTTASDGVWPGLSQAAADQLAGEISDWIGRQDDAPTDDEVLQEVRWRLTDKVPDDCLDAAADWMARCLGPYPSQTKGD